MGLFTLLGNMQLDSVSIVRHQKQYKMKVLCKKYTTERKDMMEKIIERARLRGEGLKDRLKCGDNGTGRKLLIHFS